MDNDDDYCDGTVKADSPIHESSDQLHDGETSSQTNTFLQEKWLATFCYFDFWQK